MMARLVLNTFGDRTTIPIAQVVLADNSKRNLLRYIGNKLNWWNFHDFTRIPKEWKIIAHHMTISYGEPFTEKLQEDIDNEKGVHLFVRRFGVSKDAIAAEVEGYESSNKIAHITIAIPPDGKAKNSNDITEWYEVTGCCVLYGVVTDCSINLERKKHG